MMSPASLLGSSLSGCCNRGWRSCRRTLGDQGSNAARIAAEIRRKGLASAQRKTVAVSGTAHGADESCGLVSEIMPIMKEKIQSETVSKTLHCNLRPPLPDKLGPHGQSKPNPRRIDAVHLVTNQAYNHLASRTLGRVDMTLRLVHLGELGRLIQTFVVTLAQVRSPTWMSSRPTDATS